MDEIYTRFKCTTTEQSLHLPQVFGLDLLLPVVYSVVGPVRVPNSLIMCYVLRPTFACSMVSSWSSQGV